MDLNIIYSNRSKDLHEFHKHDGISCVKLPDYFLDDYAKHIKKNTCGLYWLYGHLGASFIKNSSESFIEKYIKNYQYNIDWTAISHNKNLSEKFIRKYQDKLDWNAMVLQQVLSEEYIEIFQDKIDKICWRLISRIPDLSEEFIIKHLDVLYLPSILEYQDITQRLIEKISSHKYLKGKNLSQIIKYNDKSIKKLLENKSDYDDIDWKKLFRCKKISESSLEIIINKYNYFQNNPVYEKISSYELSESFIIKYLYFGKLNKISLLKNNKLSAAFIEKHLNKFAQNQDDLYKTQNIPERLIEKMIDSSPLTYFVFGDYYWVHISKYQKISKSFIKKYINELNLIYLSDNKNIWNLDIKFLKGFQNDINQHINKYIIKCIVSIIIDY